MKVKLKVTVSGVIEVDTNNFRIKTADWAAEDTLRALRDGAIVVEELLAFAKDIETKVEVVD